MTDPEGRADEPPDAAPADALDAAPADVLDGASAAPDIAPGRPLESYDLPTARQVVGRGLQLAYDSTGDLRRASLYVGLYLAAVVGPFAVLLLVDIPKLSAINFSAPDEISPAQAASILKLIGPLYGAGALALLGFLTVQVDGLLMAVSLLAGRAVGRPLELREALVRARQAFWRYGVAAFVVGVISTVVTVVILFASGAFRGTSSLGASLMASFISTLVVLPFGYIATAIVIGDVTGGAALRRSIVLVRARFRLAFAVAAFAFAASALQTFGLGIAAEVVGLAAQTLHLNLDLTGAGLLVAFPLVVVALMALGSLIITVDAVTVAPQVAAFLGLTRYSGGIERARRPVAALVRPAVSPASAPDPVAEPALDPTAEPAQFEPVAALATPIAPPAKPVRTRWITIPMAILIALEALVAFVGVTSSAPVAASSFDELVATLEAVSSPGIATLDGAPLGLDDALRDQAGGAWPQADVTSGEIARVPVVPAWLLARVFNCGQLDVACSVGAGGATTFDAGALLVSIRLAAPRAELRYGDDGTWAVSFDLPGRVPAPPGNEPYSLASTAVVTRSSPAGLTIERLVWETGAFREEPTGARSKWVGDTLLVLLPIRDEFDAAPIGWDEYASVQGAGATGYVVAEDWLGEPIRGLIPGRPLPNLLFTFGLTAP